MPPRPLIPRPLILGALAATALLAAALHIAPVQAERPPSVMPPAALDSTPQSGLQPGLQTAIFAGGCFWGVQGVFQHIEGVTQAVSGYAGGTTPNPTYESVSSGATGHTEAVQVTFDPARVSYATLLRIFFSVALDPTQLNRQGPDTGTQYRSALFTAAPEHETTARAYVAQLDAAKIFPRPIVTTIAPAGPFYPAEPYHQDYLVRHPTQPYIAYNDIPKVEAVKHLFPTNWRETPVLVAP